MRKPSRKNQWVLIRGTGCQYRETWEFSPGLMRRSQDQKRGESGSWETGEHLLAFAADFMVLCGCVSLLAWLKSIKGGAATWHRLEPHGPPLVELRGKAGKGLVGLLTPWDCAPEAGEDFLKQEMWGKIEKEEVTTQIWTLMLCSTYFPTY